MAQKHVIKMMVLCVPLGETLLQSNHVWERSDPNSNDPNNLPSASCHLGWGDKVKVFSSKENLHSFRLAHNGVDIKHQKYWKTGTAVPWYRNVPLGGAEDEPNFLMSITKTVTGLATARAVQLGYINFNGRVTDYIKSDGENFPPNIQKLTVEHCLNMVSGLDWKLSNESPQSILISANKTSLPGKTYNYSSTDPQMLMYVLNSTCPGGASNFIEAEVFRPLGITKYKWQQIRGVPEASAGLSLTAKDMWAIGQLMLDDGVLNGQQFIPKSYVSVANSEYEYPNEEYMYFWHHDGRGFSFSAGAGGQLICIDPKQKTLMVTTGASNEMLVPLINMFHEIRQCISFCTYFGHCWTPPA